jgi:Superfamily I DNA and RNA helicases and helicase subunits
MGQSLHYHIETWKKLLLDFGKRNRLINFKDGKRANVKIVTPSFEKLFDMVAVQEKNIKFPFAKKVQIDDDGEETYDSIVSGDIEVAESLGELQKTLKVLRYKANTAIEEQGTNILFLVFGLLNWKERNDSNQILLSPIILVPVRLTVESLTSPYILIPHEDEIVVNPTLLHKLENDFGIVLPEFDSAKDDIDKYIDRLTKLINNEDWGIIKDVHLTTLSFLKINMYKDLERNEEKLNSNSIVSAIAGESEPIYISSEFNNFDHDKQVKPIDTYQVVDADSSQQDAVLLSKRGLSFVLQGPPGTGKSQTITNLISEALADGKKILFVSEKMAALQVVYNRLANVGLADFCFTLHSHKANKKEILRELANSISMDRKKVREEALLQLDILERKRDTLNEYQEELHTPCSELRCSIFNVNGLLAKLENIPEFIFEIKDVENTTQTQLSERKYLLEELSKTIRKRSEDYVQNAWRNSTVEYLSNELRHDIDSNFSLILPILLEINNGILDCCKQLSITAKPSLDGLHLLINLLNLVGKSPLIPTKWIFDEDIDILENNAKQYQMIVASITTIKNELSAVYSPVIYSIEGEYVKKNIVYSLNALKNKLNDQSSDTILSNLNIYISNIDSLASVVNSVYSTSYKIAELLSVRQPLNFKEVKSLIEFADHLCVKISPTEEWFDDCSFVRMKHIATNCKNAYDEIVVLKQSVLSKFDKEIFDVDFYPILKRFRGEYGSVFRRFKSRYKNDIKLLRQYLTNGAKLSYPEAFALLNNLKIISDKIEYLEKDRELYISYFGSYYNGEDTLWSILNDALDAFDNICSFNEYISEQVKRTLLDCSMPIDELVRLCGSFNSDSVNERLRDLQTLVSVQFTDEIPYDSFRNELFSIRDLLVILREKYHQIMDARNGYAQFEEIVAELDKLATQQALERELESKKDQIVNYYENYYSGLNTDWDKLLEALNFAKDFKLFIGKTNLPKLFVDRICSDRSTVSYCNFCANKFTNLLDSVDIPLKWALGLFEESEMLVKYNLGDLCTRFSICKDEKYLLEEWVDYCSNREKCEKVGLTSYLIQVEEKSIDVAYIVDAYLKRFYRLWLDAMLPHFPAVQNFRSRMQEQTIKEFCELDKIQFKIAQSRVREKILNGIPDFNAVTSTKDEIGILKRELNKQRKLMPLRKLFNEIPNLLTTLRPCFMMSPLSVSVFLEAQGYNFDLVIFDEASQVHTEDAIGAIMRGKQVIIVGDDKQLPPTNFFTKSLNDDDFDVDIATKNNDGDAGAYGSILNEALAILPERSLRWHYRSRHEDLIAFSNIKIYDSSLVTFPSATEKAPDCGVEYIYVSDGVYDRGGKRNNIIESKRVADLVFEHYKKYPNRSLGVVAFSEAQQQAIDIAIRQKRNQNAMYEQFFLEDRDEPFFIKNLENVQGDERDTIIFSIGYAKDSRGIIHMDFGPLSRDGGYKRLNVAITRAKYNVKLVGSIVSTDIDLDRTSAEGVRLLRSYIEFAQQGMVALGKELSYNYELDFDSPFEEAVYNFLVDKGYDVVTQVGCSGFRIDMGIKDPTQSGHFAIGIECDGATYHSSRTARERDRLRQSVLETMGWTICRIWSTDWIKDQKTEGQKLINAIEKALGKLIENIDPNDNHIECGISSLDIEEDTGQIDSTEDGYGFIPYEQADISACEESELYELIKMVIKKEQPIHFEELCRRVAPLFGNQKATSKVRTGVEYQFRWHLAEDIDRDGDFIKLKDCDKVQVRIPNCADDYVRPIGYICNAELAKAMRVIAKQSYGIIPEDLFISTAREFGFRRTGDNIVSTLRNVYDDMLNKGKIKELDGKVCVE